MNYTHCSECCKECQVNRQKARMIKEKILDHTLVIWIFGFFAYICFILIIS